MTDKSWNELTEAERKAHYTDLAARREGMRSEPLLPCPFCGNPEPYRRTQYDYIGPNEGLGSGGNIAREYVNCGKCAAQHQAPNPDASHWNMRVTTPTDEWRRAVEALVNKIDKISESAEFKNIFVMAEIHGYEYRGEKWVYELDQVRALSPTKPDAPPHTKEGE